MSGTHCEHCYIAGHTAKRCPDRHRTDPQYRETCRRKLATCWALVTALDGFNAKERTEIITSALCLGVERLPASDITHQIVMKFTTEIRDGVQREIGREAEMRAIKEERELDLLDRKAAREARKRKDAAKVLQLVRA